MKQEEKVKLMNAVLAALDELETKATKSQQTQDTVEGLYEVLAFINTQK